MALWNIHLAIVFYPLGLAILFTVWNDVLQLVKYYCTMFIKTWYTVVL